MTNMFRDQEPREPRQWKYAAATILPGVATLETLYFATDLNQDPTGAALTMGCLAVAAGITSVELYNRAQERYKHVRAEQMVSREPNQLGE